MAAHYIVYSLIETKLSVMDFKRNSVIALYSAGKSNIAIVRELSYLKVNKMFVGRTIKRYNETGSIAKRYGGGRERTATSTEMIRKVKARIQRNPRRSGHQMAKELKISQRSIRRILNDVLKVKAYKLQEAHDPPPQQKKSDPREQRRTTSQKDRRKSFPVTNA